MHPDTLIPSSTLCHQRSPFTFFGLDAYFKAFLFVLKFIKSNERKRALHHGMSRLLGTKTRKGSDYVYFVVEAMGGRR